MSFSVGVYEIFSYLIPGFIYLYAVNEYLKLFGWKFVDITQYIQGGTNAPGIFAVVILILIAFITGHIFEAFRSMLLDKWLYYGAPNRSAAKIKKRMMGSNLQVGFGGDEWSVCQEVLRVRNPESIVEGERLKSVAFMMKNISAGVFLCGVLQLIEFIKHTNTPQYLIVGLLAFGVSVIAFLRARRFDEMTYRVIYTQALAYGSNLREFLENATPKWNNAKAIPEPSELVMRKEPDKTIPVRRKKLGEQQKKDR